MNPLTIAGTEIRMDSEGRFCLNDLHKASGAAKSTRPGYFFSRKETEDLLSELASETAGIPAVSTTEGRRGGTFVVKELVYAYAMWISPKFCLRVIRAYDSLVMDEIGRLNSLQSRALRAELEFLRGMQEASRCGLALRQWQQSKPNLEETLQELKGEMQPALFHLEH